MARIAKEQSGRNWEVYLDEPTYRQFRRKAAALINRETCWLSAQGDDLLQEVMLRLLQSGDNFSCSGPDHFRATVALRMSNVLIDMVRAIKAAKRGRGFQHVPLDDNTRSESGSVSQNLIIGQSFYRLGVRDARLRRVLELRMAGNASLDEIAAELSVSVRTVKRDLAKANRWIRQELSLAPLVSQVKGLGQSLSHKLAA